MKTCLVVDDSKVIRKVARHILETLNFTVSEAADGREALDSCMASSPDVILLDLMMPVVNGFDILAALRADDRFLHIPVIVLTSACDATFVTAMRALRVERILVKPFRARTLLEALAGLTAG